MRSFHLRRMVLHATLLSRHVQAASPVTVKNVNIIGTQTDSRLAVSRDGGVSVILNEGVLWLFDDTKITDASGDLLSFSSNTAAVALDSRNVTALQDITHPSTGASSSQDFLQDDASSQTGGWIPLSPREMAFNQKQTSETRLAIWPGTNPLAVSPAVALLWAPVVQVSNATNRNTKIAQPNYTYQYITLCKIEDTKSGVVATRLVNSLFAANDGGKPSGQFAPFGCFAAIVGRSSQCYDTNSPACRQRSIYLLGAWGKGLQLARLSLQDLSKSEYAYSFWQPDSCTFGARGDTSKLSTSMISYLQGSFSSGSVFYSPFFKTYLMVYMNADADSTLYLRYLDLNVLSCTSGSTSTVWQNGGINGQGITIEDVEAIVHYEWSDSQVLFNTPVPTSSMLRYNYAGIAHAEYFNRQYYQPWMYSNGGIDSTMRSPWLGHEVVTEAAAGGDGKHLMLSWTTEGNDRYEIVMARVEFDRAEGSSAERLGFTHRWKTILGVGCILMML